LSLVLIDTSVWARHNQPQVRQAIADAVEANAVAMVDPELGRRAREVQAALARRGDHRGPSPVDLITAAAAESVDAELWHCDRHFELIAQVTGQRIRGLGR
jgi:predicted nucleic acid-binding protein